MSPSPAAVVGGAYFSGPRSENETWVRGEFQAVLDQWFDWRKGLFADDPRLIGPADRLSPDRLERREVQHSPEFSVSKTILGQDYAAANARHVEGFGGVVDAPGMVLVRCVFMNPYWAAPEFRAALFPVFIALVRESLGQNLPRVV